MVFSMCSAHCKFFSLWVFPVWVFHFLWADKILYGSEIFSLKSRDFRWGFSRYCLDFASYYARAPIPLHLILTRGVTLGKCCHADNSYIFQHGNIVMGFRFHVNWKDERLLFRWSRFMFPCHANCLIESWVWLLFVNPLHSILTRGVILGEYCHADNSNIS